MEERKGTLIQCFVEARIVKPIKTLLKEVQNVPRACGILDTNSYDISFEGKKARALYPNIARVNHSCIPNCWRDFEGGDQLVILERL